MAVVSGPNHSLTFAPPEPETPVADTLPAAKGGLLNPENFGVEALNATCIAARDQARGAYRGFLFCLVMALGLSITNLIFLRLHFAFIYYGKAWLYVWGTAGAFFLLCVIQLVRSTLLGRRTTQLEDKLIELQGTMTALKFLERNTGSTAATINSTALITKLLVHPD
ncbi:MAG: hypothetical protein ACRYGF_07100 [Janthinobacterium lividum]